VLTVPVQDSPLLVCVHAVCVPLNCEQLAAVKYGPTALVAGFDVIDCYKNTLL